jgi:hypothetical protein
MTRIGRVFEENIFFVRLLTVVRVHVSRNTTI